MKYRVYILCFLGYLSIFMMRMTYSFFKPSLKEDLNLTNRFLCFIDAGVYFFFGIGVLFRYSIAPSWDIIKSFLVFTLIALVSFITLPTLFILGVRGGFMGTVALVTMAMFGFFQFNSWPITFLLVSQYFSNKYESGLIGLFTAGGAVGNVLGFLIPSLFSGLGWSTLLLMIGGFAIIATMLIGFFVKQNTQKEAQADRKQNFDIEVLQSPEERIKTSVLSTTELFEYIKSKIISNRSMFLYVFTAYIIRTIRLVFQLWIPIFFYSIGFDSIKGYMAVWFNFITVVGSFALGKFFETDAADKYIPYKDRSHMNRYILFYLSVVATVSLGAFIGQCSLIVYVVLLGAIGVSIGSSYNIAISVELFDLTRGNPREKEMLLTLVIATANILTGVEEIIFGCLISDQVPAAGKSNYTIIFIMSFIWSLVGSVLTFIRCHARNSQNNPKFETEDMPEVDQV